jgi:neutral ceramidase
MLKAGVAKLDITPPVGVRMAGFAGRVFPSLAVHDPLRARALVLDDGGRRAALVGLDLIGISDQTVAEVRKAAGSSAGIAPEALLIAGTHTHSGPTRAGDDATDQEKAYWEALPAKLIEVLNQAAADLTPARLGASSGWSAIGINRRESIPGGRVVLGRNHFGKFDTELGLIRVDHTDGKAVAALMNYACHAVCLMADNYLTSADYPGYAAHYLEQRVPGAMGMFLQGACGNVNPREAAVDHGYASGGSFNIAARAGEDLAREAARVWAKVETTDQVRIRYANRKIALPTNRPRAIKAAEETLKAAERGAARPREERNPYMTWYAPPNPERARKRLADLKQQGDAPVECEIQAISLGAATFLAWPGEIFCDFGMEIKHNSPFHPTYVIGYANGSIGYVPTPEAFEEGGYEAETAAHLADNAGLVLVEESFKLLDGLKG